MRQQLTESRSPLGGVFLYAALGGSMLLLHYYLNYPSVTTHVALMPLLLVPVAYLAARLGVYGIASAIVIAALALADDARHYHGLLIGLELALAAAMVVVGVSIGLAVRRDSAEKLAFSSAIGRSLQRLRGRPDYWRRVAMTRMGAYVTRTEAAFLSEALGARDSEVGIDVGSGSGRLEFVLTNHAELVVATDINRDDLVNMEEDRRVAPVHVGDLPSLPLRSYCADWLVAIEAPAVSDQAWFRSECARVVKEDGSIIVTVHNRHSFKAIVARLAAPWRIRRRQKWANLYYSRSVRDHIEDWAAAGFSLVTASGLYWAPVKRDSNTVWVDVFSVTERLFRLNRLRALSPWVLLHLRKSGP